MDQAWIAIFGDSPEMTQISNPIDVKKRFLLFLFRAHFFTFFNVFYFANGFYF